jgi:arginine decarboxylase
MRRLIHNNSESDAINTAKEGAINAPSPASAALPLAHEWTVQDAADLYRMAEWSEGFFCINDKGHVAVRPLPAQSLAIDISAVVQDLRVRNVPLPVLLRFQDVLQARVVRLNQAFIQAIGEAGYRNRYQGVYPIKVNQLHQVVEEVLEAGKPFGMGLESGSKAELIATLPHLGPNGMLLICNGYKDAVMLRLILAAQQIGKQVIPVVEKYGEFDHLLRLARDLSVRPRFGVRVRLGTSGAGRWAASGGDQSKFGISIPELITLLQRLKDEQLTDTFILLPENRSFPPLLAAGQPERFSGQGQWHAWCFRMSWHPVVLRCWMTLLLIVKMPLLVSGGSNEGPVGTRKG